MIGMKLEGHRALRRKLTRLSSAMQRRIARKAVSQALTPVNKAAKRNIPPEPEYHLLKKAIGKKVTTYRRTGVVWGGVAPRKEYDGMAEPGQPKPGDQIGLVEFGNESRPAVAPLRRAFDENRMTMQQIMSREVRQNVEREAARA